MANNMLKLEYIWIDGKNNLRSKLRVVKHTDVDTNFKNFPENWNWNYDGSSCYQAEGRDSEIILIPVRIYSNPFSSSRDNYLLLCETEFPDGKPTHSNMRRKARDLFKKYDDILTPRFGIEHEFFVIDNKTNYPIGYVPGESEPQGKYYCGVGFGKAIGRKFLSHVMELCEISGISITGCNFEVAPGQMEIQISDYGIKPSDDSVILKYILSRAGEEYGYTIDFSAKPLKGDWNGSGCHVNFSTNEMMNQEGGYEKIIHFIQKLEKNHKKHILVYGDDNGERLTGTHETSDMATFTFGVADRTASIRIPRETERQRCGYIEDRRPSGSADMYIVTSKLLETYVNE